MREITDWAWQAYVWLVAAVALMIGALFVALVSAVANRATRATFRFLRRVKRWMGR